MKDFIETCKYKGEIKEAIAYEQDLAYFIQPQLNSSSYLNSDSSVNDLWKSANPFISWMKDWMRKDTFRSFMKFLRHPLPTCSLIQDDVIPELKKVFDSTNAYYDYVFSSNSIKLRANELMQKFNGFYRNEIFDKLIVAHNSIVITDYIDKRNPYRFVIAITSVKAIEPDLKGNIKKIVFEGLNSEGEERYFYYTDEFYSVYKKGDKENDYILESQYSHEIGICPADFISIEPLNSRKFVIRKSIFSNLKEKFENYVNYYTLQKMVLPNGAIPVITHYKQNNKACGSTFADGSRCISGYVSRELPDGVTIKDSELPQNRVLGNKDNLLPCPVCNPKNVIQPGTVISMPVPKFGDNGERPFDLNANFVKFHYVPPEILAWWNEFINEKYSEIKYILVGKGYEDSNGQAKNKDQIARGNQTLENTLIDLSTRLSKLRKSLDTKSLRIAFGKAFKSCEIDFGSDFYLETEFELRDSLGKAIDPIDKQNLIWRINYSIYKNNPEQLERTDLLYKLLPYSTLTDSEFISLQGIDPKIKELRLNYKYYIDAFEAEYGELNDFFNNYFGENVTMSKKLEMARNLLLNKINITDYASLQDENDTRQGVAV